MSIIDRIDKLNEARGGVRDKVQKLDSQIDKFMDYLEDRIEQIDENPVFQDRAYQLLANTTKEHSEFLMAVKRVAMALDSKGAKIPLAAGVGKNMPTPPNIHQMAQAQEMVPGQEMTGGQEPEQEEEVDESSIKAFAGKLDPLAKKIRALQTVMNDIDASVASKAEDQGGGNLAKSLSQLQIVRNLQQKYMAQLLKLIMMMK
jgi:hypothetical protein